MANNQELLRQQRAQISVHISILRQLLQNLEQQKKILDQQKLDEEEKSDQQ